MQYDKGQISQWISDWEQSGQTISKYCDGKPFDKSTFYYWRKKLTGLSKAKKGSKFVAVQVTPTYIPYISIHYPSGVRLDVHAPLSMDDVRALTGC